MVESDGRGILCASALRERRLCCILLPRPGIPKPDRGKEPDGSGFGATIVSGDAHKKIVGACLCILDDDVEVAVFRECAAVEKFEFGILLRATPIFCDQLAVG